MLMYPDQEPLDLLRGHRVWRRLAMCLFDALANEATNPECGIADERFLDVAEYKRPREQATKAPLRRASRRKPGPFRVHFRPEQSAKTRRTHHIVGHGPCPHGRQKVVIE